jgi:hypothetical protein
MVRMTGAMHFLSKAAMDVVHASIESPPPEMLPKSCSKKILHRSIDIQRYLIALKKLTSRISKGPQASSLLCICSFVFLIFFPIDENISCS